MDCVHFFKTHRLCRQLHFIHFILWSAMLILHSHRSPTSWIFGTRSYLPKMGEGSNFYGIGNAIEPQLTRRAFTARTAFDSTFCLCSERVIHMFMQNLSSGNGYHPIAAQCESKPIAGDRTWSAESPTTWAYRLRYSTLSFVLYQFLPQ